MSYRSEYNKKINRELLRDFAIMLPIGAVLAFLFLLAGVPLEYFIIGFLIAMLLLK